MDEMAEPRGLRGYLAGENDGPGGGSELPVAMIRGNVRTVWRLQDAPGPEYPGQFTEPQPLAIFGGSYESARGQALAWCAEHGYYLSSWSDGDDRKPIER